MIDSSLDPIIKSLRLVVFDFDGVFTNNQVLVSQDGTESVLCDRSDGLGFRLLKAERIDAMILSMETNPVVQARARKLTLECVSNCENKLAMLQSIARERGLELGEIAYVGNDVNDVECMERVGLSVAVQDAYPEALEAAKWILTKAGGRGAIREFCEVVARVRMGLDAGQSPWKALANRVYVATDPVRTVHQ